MVFLFALTVETTDILSIAKEWGLFAALFVILFIWVIKENKCREKDYISIISQLQKTFNDVAVDSNKVIHTCEKNIDILDEKLIKVEDKVDNIDKKVDKIDDKIGNVKQRVSQRM